AVDHGLAIAMLLRRLGIDAEKVTREQQVEDLPAAVRQDDAFARHARYDPIPALDLVRLVTDFLPALIADDSRARVQDFQARLQRRGRLRIGLRAAVRFWLHRAHNAKNGPRPASGAKHPPAADGHHGCRVAEARIYA